MKARVVVAIVILVTLPLPAGAAGKVCKAAPVAPCFTLRGALFAANGTPTFRIARAGTRRILGVEGGEEPQMPKEIHDMMLATGDAFSTRISGDYRVCPATRERPGRMQFVCIEAVTRVSVTKR